VETLPPFLPAAHVGRSELSRHCAFLSLSLSGSAKYAFFHSSERAAFEIKGGDAPRLRGKPGDDGEKKLRGESEDALIILAARNNISRPGQTDKPPSKNQHPHPPHKHTHTISPLSRIFPHLL